MNTIISSVLSSAKYTFTVYVRSGLNVELIKRLTELLEQGVVVEILVEEENSSYLRQDPALHHQCGKFTDKGGAIMLVSCNEPVNAFFLIDYKSVCFVSPSSAQRVYDEIQHKEYLIKTRRYIEALKNRGLPYFQEMGDIRIDLQVNSDYIKTGESVQLKWSVKGASDVHLHGTGAVPALGSQSVALYENTILKIIARNSRHTQVRTFYVRVYGDVEINYDLGFLNPVTKQYSSLVNAENYPDVFGIMKGHSIQLNWEVNEAESVLIKPFNLKEKKGSHTFIPDSSFEIEIQASGNGESTARKIQITLFPVPVFNARITKIEESWIKKQYRFKIPGSDTLKQNGEVVAILEKAEQHYHVIGKQLKEKSLKYASEITPEALRDKMFLGIKEKYSLKKEVLGYVQKLIKEVNELRSQINITGK